MSPLHVVTVVFNPRRFASRHRLYDQFAAWLEASGVRLVTVEIAFGERPFAITDPSNPWHLQLRTRHEIWHKERALNLGLHRLSQLDPHWKYVAWMDADVRLARTDWAPETVHYLQHYAVVQMFGEARSLGPDHHMIFSCRSIGRNFEEHGAIEWKTDNPGLAKAVKKANIYARQGHPGLAWGFRRDELNDVGGWLDTCINGSGDLHMAACYSGKPDLALSPHASRSYRRSVLRYGELCNRYVRGNFSFVPGTIDHYWHGRSKERGYDDRWRLLDEHQFDPITDLVADVHGLYRWNLADPRVRALAVETRKSLAKRNEDVNEL